MALKERVSKGEILEAAEKVFSEYGFYEAKIYKIAETAGVSVGTIYRFFSSKEELYGEILKKKLTELKRKVKGNVKDQPPKEAIKAYISTVIDFFEDEKDFFNIFIREFTSISLEEKFNLSRWYQEYIKELSLIVESGIREGTFKPLEPLTVMVIISGALKNTVYARSKGILKSTPDEIKECLYQVLLTGMEKKC
jgi:AcrR family transcriptional regulator